MDWRTGGVCAVPDGSRALVADLLRVADRRGYADIRLPVERSPRTRRPRRLEIQGCGISRDGAPPGDGDRAGGVVYVVDDPVVAHPDPQSGPVSL